MIIDKFKGKSVRASAPDNRLMGRVALVTGASRGIGAAVAKRFAAEGAKVILTARSEEGLKAVDDIIRKADDKGEGATLLPFDLTRLKKIPQIAAAIYDRFGGLDILVGNAGTLEYLSPIAHSDVRDWNKIFKLNVMANQSLIVAMHPMLRASKAGRAMFVTSGAAHNIMANWGAYAASKAALEIMVKSYAAENENGNMRINLVDPLVVDTKLRDAAFPAEDKTLLLKPDDVTDIFVECASVGCGHNGEVLKSEVRNQKSEV